MTWHINPFIVTDIWAFYHDNHIDLFMLTDTWAFYHDNHVDLFILADTWSILCWQPHAYTCFRLTDTLAIFTMTTTYTCYADRHMGIFTMATTYTCYAYRHMSYFYHDNHICLLCWQTYGPFYHGNHINLLHWEIDGPFCTCLIPFAPIWLWLPWFAQIPFYPDRSIVHLPC